MQALSRGNLFTQKLGIFLDDTYPRLRSLRRRIERDLSAGANVRRWRRWRHCAGDPDVTRMLLVLALQP